MGSLVSMGTLSYIMWHLVPWPGTEPTPPALGVQSLSHWNTREVPLFWILIQHCPVHFLFVMRKCTAHTALSHQPKTTSKLLKLTWGSKPAFSHIIRHHHSHWTYEGRDIKKLAWGNKTRRWQSLGFYQAVLAVIPPTSLSLLQRTVVWPLSWP